MTNLREILNQYQAGDRGLPTFKECCEIAAHIDDLQKRFTELATGEHDEQRDRFERDCV